MGYKNKTKFYRIPVMGAGDRMTESQNMKQWSIVDNLLYTATFGCQKCFLEQGKYSLQFSSSGRSCNLVIQPVGNDGFSLMGMLNYRLFYSKDRLVIGTMFADMQYYVYVEYEESMETNPFAYQINFYNYQKQVNKYRMLLCIVRTTKDPVIDLDVNKVYSKNILAHTMDITNPHGKNLYQDNLFVDNKLMLNEKQIYPYFYDSFYTSQNYLYPVTDKNVVFVTAYPEDVSAGIISWKIVKGGIVFNNTGENGIKVNIKVEYNNAN